MNLFKKHTEKPLYCDTCGTSFEKGAAIGATIFNSSFKNIPATWDSRVLEWKTLYILCLPCVKIIDDGYPDKGLNDIAESILDKSPHVMGALSCSVDEAGNIVPARTPLNYVRPVNMMRLMLLKLYRQDPRYNSCV